MEVTGKGSGKVLERWKFKSVQNDVKSIRLLFRDRKKSGTDQCLVEMWIAAHCRVMYILQYLHTFMLRYNDNDYGKDLCALETM